MTALPTCSACGRPIEALRTRYLLGGDRVVCGDCLVSAQGHAAMFPWCAVAQHRAFDHDHAPLTPAGRRYRGVLS